MKGRQRKNFDFPAKRRREIVLHGRYVGAAKTEDFTRWLIAWVWHNPKAKDQIWSVMEAAKRMGGKITEAEASAITEEASITRKQLSADNLARFLGVTYAQREELGIKTIGSIDVKRGARKVLRQRKDRLYRERKRRASGVRARSDYEANSVAAKARAAGVSRMTIYRRKRAAEPTKNSPNVTGVSAAIFLSSEDRPVTQGRPNARKRNSSGASPRRKEEAIRLATATTMAADRHETLPLELRLLALGLPIPSGRPKAIPQPEKIAAAA